MRKSWNFVFQDFNRPGRPAGPAQGRRAGPAGTQEHRRG